jgi:DNA-binding NarL/FixJ family response regulator
MYKKRCVIVNQDAKFITVISSILELSDKFIFVEGYSNCEEAIKCLKNDRPDIILMDIDFSDLKGADAVEEIKNNYSKAEILIITDYIDDEIVFDVLSAGAAGYLLKKYCIPDLLECLLDLAKGGSPLDPQIARKLINNIHLNRFSPLTNRETEVLKRIAHGKTYSLIADELGISSETSKTHIKNIYRKLKVNSKSEAVTKAISEKLINVHSS